MLLAISNALWSFQQIRFHPLLFPGKSALGSNLFLFSSHSYRLSLRQQSSLQVTVKGKRKKKGRIRCVSFRWFGANKLGCVVLPEGGGIGYTRQCRNKRSRRSRGRTPETQQVAWQPPENLVEGEERKPVNSAVDERKARQSFRRFFQPGQ